RGRPDFVVNNMWDVPTLLRDTLGTSNHWVQVQLAGTETNPHGIGSRVRIVAGGRSQFNEVRSGASFCSQNDLRLYFGLGRATRVERLEVSWLGGKAESFTDLPADHLLVVRQGGGITARKPLSLESDKAWPR